MYKTLTSAVYIRFLISISSLSESYTVIILDQLIREYVLVHIRIVYHTPHHPGIIDPEVKNLHTDYANTFSRQTSRPLGDEAKISLVESNQRLKTPIQHPMRAQN